MNTVRVMLYRNTMCSRTSQYLKLNSLMINKICKFHSLHAVGSIEKKRILNTKKKIPNETEIFIMIIFPQKLTSP